MSTLPLPPSSSPWTVEEATKVSWGRSIPEPNTGCWLWEGQLDQKGYALLEIRGVRHRLSRAILGLPRGSRAGRTAVLACHRCDTPSCVNPGHLFAGTHRDNMLDLRHKGHKRRTMCARGHPLTADNILTMRRRASPHAAHLAPNRECLTCHRDRRRRKSAICRAKKRTQNHAA